MADKILNFLKHSDDDPFNLFFETAPIMMHSIDRDGVLLKVSTFWADTLGYENDEMIGRRSTDFLTDESKAYAAEVLREYYATGRIMNVEYDFVRKDGSIIPVLMSATAEYDGAGEFRRSLAVMFDNTVAKRAKAELAQKQRMEAVGRLVGGVAHDFNNLLTVIQGNLEFLRDDLDHQNREAYLHDAFGAARRGAALTQQLLSYGRKAHLSPQKIDLNSVLRDTDGMLRRLMPATISFETVATGGLWSTKLDRAQLETALLNLINNARDAMPEGGRITMETANTRITEDYVAERGEEIKPGRFVMLAISDTGEGMPQHVAERAFEPFFTTRPVGSGTGLGLSMVQGFVRQSQGTIRIYSEPGIGTTVKLYFPAVDTTVSGGSEPTEDETTEDLLPQSLLADILVVEDEADVRKVIVQQLQQRGMKVAEASSGDLAHGLLVTGYRPKVLVTDVVMPGKLQGPDLAKAARELIPDIKTVFISGYPNEAAIHGNGLRVTDMQLVKPVPRETLVGTVKKMLGED